MVSHVLIAIIGNQVFPGYVGWWIAYAAISSCVSVSRNNDIKKLKENA